ncbi:MAG TPA: cyanophycinase [Pirellulaceae bacterium]|nr:cyanophycinase [Pirellulaceae bacterium]
MAALRCMVAWFGMLACANSLSAQSLENPLGVVGQANKPGALIVCGGGKLPEEVYDEFVRLAGGKDAHLVHIPWAHPFSSMSSVRYSYHGWSGMDVASFAFLNINARSEADLDTLIKPLETATGVWIGGGSQGRLADLYGNTKVEAALQRLLARGGVIGGTSAGASIMSTTMIRSGTASEAVTDRGLCLVKHAVIDQHFSQRHRLERLLNIVEESQLHVGIGVDEGAALVLQGNRLRAIGDSKVTICVPGGRGNDVTLHRLRGGDNATLVAGTHSATNRLGWELRRQATK